MFWINIKLAWRNVFRNTRRSVIAGTAIGIGLASLIFVDAMIIGMKDNMIQSATASFLGEGQIHRKGFRQSMEADLTIRQADSIIAGLKKEKLVKYWAPRVLTYGMITSPSQANSIQLVGIQPSREKHISLIDEVLVKGSYFQSNNPRNIIIGKKLAEILEVEMGDRVVLTVSDAESGDLSQEMFRISGITHFNVREMDRGMAFIRLPRAQKMLGIGNGIHEIALKFGSARIGRKADHPFWDRYSRFGNKAVGWTVLLPQLKAALDLTDFSTFIIAIILFGVVALGIVNTLFMSLHERIFEFGVLRAVGTRPFQVGTLILYEAGSLAILSIGIGIIIGFTVTYILSRVGIDYTGIEFAGVTFRHLIYPVLTWDQFVQYPFWVFVFTVFTGIYPSLYAARLKPAKALRKSL